MRLRGWSGLRPLFSAIWTPRSLNLDQFSEGSALGMTTWAPNPRISSSKPSSGGDRNQMVLFQSVMLFGPWRYSKIG